MELSITVTWPTIAEPQLPADYKFVRVLHEAELPVSRRVTPPKMPEVRPLFPNHFAWFGEGWQDLAWSLNPMLNAGNMTAVYNEALWIANNTGFGSEPIRNYFVPEDLDAPKDLKVEALTCGGNILHVVGEGRAKTNDGIEDVYYIECLDWRVVPVFDLNKKPWLITTATKLNPEGLPTRFPQGRQPNGFQPGVRHPFVADTVRFPGIAIPKWRCEVWESAFAPDPYKIYS